ncbi:MAG: cupredoxin domain-containing protein [Candidatus Dormibacteraeota bacterium]|uniref:Cupredoxin domain-containing protein n=1 Tax=Candidatus Amunia macphersoniae TaxID=3127014 RepID=A0A934KP80_9BACT|nr:cupredoxin domain-containing protein [Candidatus Dormibacteraeota bacterium]
MPNPTKRWILFLVATVGLAACGGTTTPSSPATAGATSTASPAGGATPGITVTAHDFGFDPTALTVAPGASVTLTFVNTGAVKHNVTATAANVNLDGDAGTTQTTTFTAPQSGTISFHCQYHPTKMTGTITVGTAAASGPSAGPSPSPATTGGY